MQFLFLPLTLLSSFFNKFGFFLILLCVLWKLFEKPLKISLIIPSWKIIIIFLAIFLLQFLAMLLSFPSTSKGPVPIGVPNTVLKLIEQILMIWLIYAFTKLYIVSKSDAIKFIRWGIIGFLIYFVLVILPQIFITLGLHSFNGYVNFLASLFEQHWSGRNDFYSFGSYAVTQQRVNGFESESPVFANLIGVVYLPLMIGLLVGKDHSVFKKTNFFLWIGIFASMFSLLLAKTTTGIVTILLAYAFWIIFSQTKDRKKIIYLGILILIILGIGYLFLPSFQSLINNFLFHKQGTSNRIGGTISLFLVFLSKPLIGTGEGFTSYFINQNVPLSTTHNWEYLHIYKKLGYPVLSGFLGWFAQFGLIIMIPVIFFIFKYIFSIFRQRKFLLKNNGEHNNFYSSILSSAEIMICITIPLSFLAFNIFQWPMIFVLFFYWRVFLLSKKTSNQKLLKNNYI